MVQLSRISRLTAIVAISLMPFQVGHSETGIPPAILDVWRATYEQYADEFVEDLLKAYENDPNIPESKKAIVLADVEQFLKTELSWDRRGNDVVSSSLISMCGEDLLRQLTPYFDRSKDWESANEEIRSAYVDCYIEADFQVSTSVPGFLMERESIEKLMQIFQNHGVRPR